MKREIFKIMTKEHEVIESLLDDFKKSQINDSLEAKKIFQTFVWNIEKHMFLEEKILYNVYSVWDGNIEGMFEILEQHGEIIALIKKIKNSYPDEKNLSALKELLRDHFVLEETLLYPNLEKVLNGEQKEFLIERAQEIIRG
ncbi:MAG: hemerythrin domain-containing protein [Candidatus Pacearchaeota archaeon]|nr:hemerythrin domain-containing protein [Candidatus Pacearchaeota archaeon]